MRYLDLACGAGMATEGYIRAGMGEGPYPTDGWLGVDIRPQPHYPATFQVGDLLEWLQIDLAKHVDFVHVSPPCQLFTRAKHLRDAQGSKSKEQMDLLTPTLKALEKQSVPWVVENVEGARHLMPNPVRVCGSSFGLEVQRHRLFSSNLPIKGTQCDHSVFPPDPITGKPRPWGVYHVPKDSIPKGGRTATSDEHARSLFQVDREIPWASLKEGFPPTYTEYIGAQVMAWLRSS